MCVCCACATTLTRAFEPSLFSIINDLEGVTGASSSTGRGRSSGDGGGVSAYGDDVGELVDLLRGSDGAIGSSRAHSRSKPSSRDVRYGAP